MMGQCKWLLLLVLILDKQPHMQDVLRKNIKRDQITDILKTLSALISEAKEAKATSKSFEEDSVFGIFLLLLLIMTNLGKNTRVET